MKKVVETMLATATLLTILFLLLRGLSAKASLTAPRVDGIANSGGIQLSPGSTKKAEPGAVVSYAHRLTNTYLGFSVVVTLSSESSQGWEVDHSPTETIQAGETEIMAIGVRVPSDVVGLDVETTMTDVTTVTAAWEPPLGGAPKSVTATDTTLVERFSQGVRLPLVLRAYIPAWSSGGLEGNTAYQIAVCAGDPNQLYAGTETGVFRSTDAGASWQTTALQGVRVRGLDVAADDCDEIYAATWGQYVQRSVNGGNSWETLNEGLPGPYLYTVVVDDGQPRPIPLYAGTAENGVYQYPDNILGDHWKAIFDENGLIIARLTLIESGKMLVASWGSNAYELSFELGRWNETLLNVPEENVFEVVQAADGDLFAATDNYLYRRSGEGWTPVHDQRAYGVALDPDQAELVYAATGEGALRSTSGGETFEPFGLDGMTVRDVAPGPTGSGLLHAGTIDGAWRRSRP